MPGVLDAIRGMLIVSCQAGDGHPMRDSVAITRMARSGVAGGAAAIRCGGVGGVADVAAVAEAVYVPVIGLTKDGKEGVYITPTVRAALDVVAAGADIVAVDATDRPRPDGASFVDTVTAVHEAGKLVMADVSTLSEGVRAAADGADLIASTLSGYTVESPTQDGPDIVLVASLREALPDIPIVAEGRVHRPADVAAAIDAGATSVVVGTAITDPVCITGTFAAALPTAT